ncbi:ABC transporter permease [Lysinimonas soli]|uniref:ABC transporter permease n=1 Tax=Lysinimonas soli TaxID=1074233 RepID=A0ABW0NL21_9MICO
MTLGQLNPGGSDAGTPGGEDPRNVANLQAAGVLDNAEASIEMREVEGLSLGRIVLRRFLRHRAAMASLILLLIVIVFAFSSEGIDAFGIRLPGWWRWDYAAVPDVINQGRPTLSLVPLNWGIHPFGQDSVGHDMFAQVMRGTQQSLMIVFVAGIVSTVIGVTLGAAAGYFGGWIDSLLMRATDIFIIVPLYLIAAIVGHTLVGAGSVVLAIFLGVLVWTTLARLVRGEVLALREREFVEAAKVAGASDFRIVFRHILPNTVGVIVVSATLTMSATILTEAAISFLGFGVRAPDTSLGLIISNYQSAFSTRPWLFWWPGLFIVIIALTINFIGDGLRDAFDPRQRRGLNRRARRERALAVDHVPEPVGSES